MTGRAIGWIAVALVFGWGVAWAMKGPSAPEKACTLTFSNGYQIGAVPVAVSKSQQAKGLSNREEVGPGMLFDFGEPARLAFWMKDTRFPLSIGFFDGQGKLLRSEEMAAESQTYHLSMDLARYALELPKGAYGSAGLEPGVVLTVGNCRQL